MLLASVRTSTNTLRIWPSRTPSLTQGALNKALDSYNMWEPMSLDCTDRGWVSRMFMACHQLYKRTYFVNSKNYLRKIVFEWLQLRISTVAYESLLESESWNARDWVMAQPDSDTGARLRYEKLQSSPKVKVSALNYTISKSIQPTTLIIRNWLAQVAWFLKLKSRHWSKREWKIFKPDVNGCRSVCVWYWPQLGI